MLKFKKILKNCWPYTLFSTLAVFVFGIKYGIYFNIGLAVCFIAYYFSLKLANLYSIKDKRIGNTKVSLKMFLGNVLITYAFSLAPLLVWSIIEILK